MKKATPAIVFMALGAAAMLLGAYRGEIETVLRKAVMLCLECVGIG
ncbi:MAG: hypothetical protein IJC54_06195 [Clostridia bacterium]|nr:hypothetical protein [Clostridia bacterium]